ncbi:hypothetical protein BJ138DRAFT_1154687 [Hygrophoropsis aurantiaca]|uniref:Uncharacterized protein n=1 Tax=Hygrophoropsis aurantiaca TaxID=72124 RepID=A0ACB8A9E7_9AGAM|nr:hypothetical protein BJ138DRAFT_1154687 [Hygrophoropsis aurantiaca]
MLVPLTFPVSAASAVHADVHAGVNNFDRPAYTGARAIHTPVSKTPVSLNVLETSILSEFGTVGLSSTSFVSWDENDGYARPKSISNDVGSPSIPGISGSEGISNPNHRATTGELRGPRGVALGGKDGSVYIFHPSSIISPPFESASSAALSRSSRSSTQLPIINLGVPSSASRSASPATFNAGTHDQNLTRAHSHSRRYSRTLQLQTGTSHPHSHSRTSSHTHSHSHSRSRSHSASPTSSSLSLALMATTPGALMSHSVSPRARVVSGLSKEQAEASVPRTLASKHARPGKGNHEELDDEQERLKSILKGLESNGGGSGGVREHGLVDGLIPSFDKGIVLETSSEATFGAGNARDDNNSLASPRSLLSATNSPSFVPKVLPGPELPGTQSASTSIPALKSKSAPSSPYLFSPPLNPTSPPPGTTSPPSLHLAPSPAYDLNSPPHGLALKVHTFPPRCGLGHSVRDMCVISASDIFASHGISSAKKEVRGTQKTMIISLQASGNVSVFDSRDGTLLASASTVTNFTPSAPITGSSTLNSRNTTRSWTWTGMRVVRPGFIDANTSWNVGMGIRRNDDEVSIVLSCFEWV